MRWQAVTGWSIATAAASGAVIAICAATKAVQEVISPTPEHDAEEGGGSVSPLFSAP